MRPKFVLTATGLAALVLGIAFYFKPPFRSETETAMATTPPAAVETNPAAASNFTKRVAPPPVGIIATHTMTPEEKQDYIQAETGRLQEWSRNNDPASLSAILRDLTNSVKEVRLAAIEAAKQFGSRDAIPVLKGGVANAQDTDEQMALLSAADFLSLPSIADPDVQQPRTPEQTQAGQQRRAQDTARRLAQMQQQIQILQQAQTQQPAPSQNPPADPNH